MQAVKISWWDRFRMWRNHICPICFRLKDKGYSCPICGPLLRLQEVEKKRLKKYAKRDRKYDLVASFKRKYGTVEDGN